MQHENMSRFERFEYWLTNIFWFHYKWYFLLGIFVLTFLVLTAFQALTTVNYDRTVVYAHMGTVNQQKTEEVRTYVQDVADAFTGGKEKLVDVFEIAGSDEASKNGQRNIYAAFTSSDYALMLIDKPFLDLYSAMGYFEQIPGLDPGDKCVYIESLDLYAVVNKGQVKQYTMAEAIAKGVEMTEEELIKINEDLQKEYDDYIDQTIEMVKSMS